jgi:hypothetical protein
MLYLAVFLLVVLLFVGCGRDIPSTSFDAEVSVEEKAQKSMEEHVKDNRDVAAENATEAEERLKDSATDAYDRLMEATNTAQKIGAKGIAQRILYKFYVIYYTLCDYAIPIMCVGWGLAALCIFIFGKLKVPKYQKMGIIWFGIFPTIVMIVILFLPMFIKWLGA